MNCRQSEQWLLLMDSGELSAGKRLRLEEHLTGCAKCRAYRDDLDRVLALARRSLPAGAPAPRTLAAIRDAARAGVPRQQAAAWSWSMTVWRPVLAAAAILLVCLGGWYWLAGRVAPSGGTTVAWQQPAIKTVSPVAANNNDELTALLLEDVVVIEQLSDIAKRQEVSALDRDLLLLEGMAI